MGLEANCKAQFGKNASEGKAHLDANALTFRGEFRLDIPLKSVKEVEAKRGELYVTFDEGLARFVLGKQSEAWALKIRYPKNLIDKLGVKSGQKVSVLGVADGIFSQQLEERTQSISVGKAAKDSDWIFFGVNEAKALSRLVTLREAIQRDGAIWVIWPKGQAHIKEDMVRAAALEVELVDVKVVSFSETHSGLKLMIPKAKRGGKIPS
ncbi:MAG: hypothetical protein AAB354_09480 [candidate division KSB1 bacterium]